MENKTITNTKKVFIIFGVVCIGMILGISIWKTTGKSFLFDENDRFMDYFNTINVSKDVYSGVGPGRCYFPVTYVLLNMVDFVICSDAMGYIITFICTCCLMLVFYAFFMKKWNFWVIALITFLSYPMMFVFDRGNIEYLVLLFTMLFFIAYKKEKYKAAAIILAFPICMKLYPALFSILFLKNKKYKEFILCGVFSILLMIGSFVVIGGNITNLPVALENFKYFTDDCAKTISGVQYSHTIWSGLNYLSAMINNVLLETSTMTIYTIIIGTLAIILIGYIVFLEREEWKAITILTIMMIIFPHVSFDYTLIHMFIPIVFFVISKHTKMWEEILYSILFGLTLIPMNWWQVIANKQYILNIGLILRPLILISIILIIVITTMKRAIQKKKEAMLVCK